MRARIERVWIERLPDENPPLGTYTDNPPVKEGVIDRKARGDWKTGEMRYYLPNVAEMGEWEYEIAENPELYELVGILANARLLTEEDCFIVISSPGTWEVVIEKGSSNNHLKRIEQEEMGILTGLLTKLGFDDNDIQKGKMANA